MIAGASQDVLTDLLKNAETLQSLRNRKTPLSV
jgi:hypothetical protein